MQGIHSITLMKHTAWLQDSLARLGRWRLLLLHNFPPYRHQVQNQVACHRLAQADQQLVNYALAHSAMIL